MQDVRGIGQIRGVNETAGSGGEKTTIQIDGNMKSYVGLVEE